jgi:hypothetical protein
MRKSLYHSPEPHKSLKTLKLEFFMEGVAEPTYKKRLKRGDYYYKEGDGMIKSYGSFNCEGGYNYLSYFQAREIMGMVDNWILEGQHWTREGYSGSVGSMRVVIRLGEDGHGSYGLGRLRIRDNANGLMLAVYQNKELWGDFHQVHKPFQDREEGLGQQIRDASLSRVQAILGRVSPMSFNYY